MNWWVSKSEFCLTNEGELLWWMGVIECYCSQGEQRTEKIHFLQLFFPLRLSEMHRSWVQGLPLVQNPSLPHFLSFLQGGSIPVLRDLNNICPRTKLPLACGAPVFLLRMIFFFVPGTCHKQRRIKEVTGPACWMLTETIELSYFVSLRPKCQSLISLSLILFYL